MAKLRRYYVPNSLIFMTSVTNNRVCYFSDPDSRNLLLQVMKSVQTIHPYHLLAYVILPDHYHWIMQLRDGTTNYSQIIQSVKWNFTLDYKKAHHIDGSIQLWQPRLWDHIIRDESDLEKHMDYIHYNPVKHGVAKAPSEWKHSTYQFWQDRGIYRSGWGIVEAPESISGLMME